MHKWRLPALAARQPRPNLRSNPTQQLLGDLRRPLPQPSQSYNPAAAQTLDEVLAAALTQVGHAYFQTAYQVMHELDRTARRLFRGRGRKLFQGQPNDLGASATHTPCQMLQPIRESIVDAQRYLSLHASFRHLHFNVMQRNAAVNPLASLGSIVDYGDRED